MKHILSRCALIALLQTTALAASERDTPVKPCTIRSEASGAFFDLNTLAVVLPEEGKKAHKDDRTASWQARGYDYPANFTINFCAPVVEDLKDVVGVERGMVKNISAYYELDKQVYSLGQLNTEPVIRGSKLVLNYTDGSPCPASPSNLHRREIVDKPGKGHKGDDDDDDDDKDADKSRRPSKEEPRRRKGAIISLLCDSNPLAPRARVSFVATLDECTYHFEVRSAAACAGSQPAQQTLSPGGVFGVIMFIAIGVYLVGGCVYQRTVMHQRGWRQLPNYTMWAAIGSFIKDMFVILFSSCSRFLPSRRGYNRVGSAGVGRGRSNEDENRLIDQYDEEWDD